VTATVTTFQSTPRFVGEGNGLGGVQRLSLLGFNPPPASSARGTAWRRRERDETGVSIHPPLRRRGERSGAKTAGTASRFQSTPRFVGEGNEDDQVLVVVQGVSIHPPLRRRGELDRRVNASRRVGLQSPPRFVGEGNRSRPGADGRPVGFNPPPASSARGTRRDAGPPGDRPGFNPPPALSARGTGDPHSHGWVRRVSIHPPLCRRGELVVGRQQPDGHLVSIHPPLCRRGELGVLCSPAILLTFQSTPRFVGEGNPHGACAEAWT